VSRLPVSRCLYQGAVELIAAAVARADRGEIDRDEAWRRIGSVLREVERHAGQGAERAERALEEKGVRSELISPLPQGCSGGGRVYGLSGGRCRRRAVDAAPRGRRGLTTDDDVVVYCPECAEREFSDRDT
jgi:hypothetical protein